LKGAVVKTLLSYRVLVPLALLLGFAPFVPEPHVVAKSRMLLAGELGRPLDIFDLFWHAWPLALLGLRAGRDLGERLVGKKV
jgi:hypothetical protein